MSPAHDSALTRLLQLASPALPVGAYSYSQGMESAIAAGIVRDAAGAQAWIIDVLELAMVRLEAPVLLRLHRSWRAADRAGAAHWNEYFLASRESAELRAETVQMGYSLTRLLADLGAGTAPAGWEETSFPAAFARAAAHWQIDESDCLVAYLWSWAENQVMAAMKTVPLGQSAGQRILFSLGGTLTNAAARAAARGDDDLENFAPGLALLCAQHETLYTRLFRS